MPSFIIPTYKVLLNDLIARIQAIQAHTQAVADRPARMLASAHRLLGAEHALLQMRGSVNYLEEWLEIEEDEIYAAHAGPTHDPTPVRECLCSVCWRVRQREREKEAREPPKIG